MAQSEVSTLNLAAYCSGDFGPGISDELIANVQQSGLTTIILWSMHIGRPSIPGQQYGDLVFNSGDIRIVSEGVYNPGVKDNNAFADDGRTVCKSGQFARFFPSFTCFANSFPSH